MDPFRCCDGNSSVPDARTPTKQLGFRALGIRPSHSSVSTDDRRYTSSLEDIVCNRNWNGLCPSSVPNHDRTIGFGLSSSPSRYKFRRLPCQRL